MFCIILKKLSTRLYVMEVEYTSQITSARDGLQSNNQRRGVIPFVLF